MPDNLNDPVVERRVDRTVVERDSSGWIAAILGILVVLGLIFYFNGYVPLPEKTASNTTVTTTTEKVVPPATREKPATEPTKTEPATQPQ
jgi:hypothetical protein